MSCRNSKHTWGSGKSRTLTFRKAVLRIESSDFRLGSGGKSNRRVENLPFFDRLERGNLPQRAINSTNIRSYTKHKSSKLLSMRCKISSPEKLLQELETAAEKETGLV